jgi:hypothetical protein
MLRLPMTAVKRFYNYDHSVSQQSACCQKVNLA